MKAFRYILTLLMVSAVSITARNQDANRLELTDDGPFIVKAIYIDKDGVKWFGTNRGLCRFNDLSWTYYTDSDYLIGNQVNALAFEQSDMGPELWVATTEGVTVVAFDADGITGSRSYTTAEGLLNNGVNDIGIDSRHGKFFGSKDGITWFHDGVMDSIIYAEYYSSMLSSPIRQMEVYNDTLYLAQDGGIGRMISGVDGITGASRWTSEYGVSPYSDDIYSVKVEGSVIQYFGCDAGIETHTGYFAKENWNLLSTDDGLVNNHVISIAKDEEGGMWFGTLGGVTHLYEGTWTSYTSSEGLLNDTVYDIGFDLDGAVWFATGAGACRLKDGHFSDFITSLPDQSVSRLEMQAYYHQAEGNIHLAYQLDQSVAVSARLYDIRGLLVASWKDLSSLKGPNRETLSLLDKYQGGSPQGIHIIQLIHGTDSNTKKLIIYY